MIDHTFAPLLCRPLELGAEAVTHSATKLIGGHSDLTLGLLAGPRSLPLETRHTGDGGLEQALERLVEEETPTC